MSSQSTLNLTFALALTTALRLTSLSGDCHLQSVSNTTSFLHSFWSKVYWQDLA